MKIASVLSLEDVRVATRPVIRALIESKLSTPIACSAFVRKGKENDYSRLNSYSDKKGIYRFIGPVEGTSEKETLYVGTSGHGAHHRLKDRVVQNFTGSSGATFIEKLAKDRFGGDKKAAAKWVLGNASIQLVETPDKEHGKLERLAIEVFEPKYK